jgi:DUF1009 family protein
LGLIAGGGELPADIVRRCRDQGRQVFVLRLKGFADPASLDAPGADVGMAELGRQLSLLRKAGCSSVCFAGTVKRPDFAALKPDFRGLRSLPGAVAAAAKGDDALLRFLIAEFEAEGFRVEGADSIGVVTLGLGPLGRLAVHPRHEADVELAVRAARALGALDIGQAVVVARGVVLAVEAQEGTDALLARCVSLPEALKGTADARVGVLVKWPKATQERRIDLPTIGLATIEGAAAAGLAGVAGEAGATLLLHGDAVIEAADRLGLFVAGLDAGTGAP